MSQQEWLEAVKAEMKRRKISGAWLSRRLDCSASNVNAILRGNWPFYGRWMWPLYFEQYVVENFRINPPPQDYK